MGQAQSLSKINPVVMIARNNLQLTKRAIGTVLAQDIESGVHLQVYNNQCSDGTAEYLNSLENQRVQVLHPNRQCSVAELWNVGLGFCFHTFDSEYALVVNNDVELRPETYRLLVSSGHLFATAVGVNSRAQMQGDITLKDRPHPDFSCFLIRRECWERVGKFDERFLVAFAEDCDYHVRMHRQGIQAMCIGVPFYHVGSATVKQSSPEERERIHRQAEANRELFFQLHGARIGTPGYESLFSGDTFGIDCVDCTHDVQRIESGSSRGDGGAIKDRV